MVFPQTPLNFAVELWIDGAWQGITSDVRHGDKIQIFRGRRAESGRPEPSSCRMTLSNEGAKYTPSNPLSPLYGKIGRNTYLRVLVDGVGRFVGEVSTWPQQWTEGGKDAWVSIEAAGVLRHLDSRRSPLMSTLRRRVSSDANVVAYWPMEEESGATSAYSPLQGVPPLRVSGLTFAADDSLGGSASLPSVGTGASLQGAVPTATATGKWMVTLLVNMAAPPTTPIELLSIATTGTAGRPVSVELANGSISLRAIADDGARTTISSTTPELYDGWCRLEVTAAASGTDNTLLHLGWVNLTTNHGFGLSQVFFGTPGCVTQVNAAFSADLAGMKLGHLGVFKTDNTVIYVGAERGFVGEDALNRFGRLCVEERVATGTAGSSNIPMGAQGRSRFLDLLYECADADGGLIYESRVEPRIRYRSRTNLYNQAPKLVLDYRQHLVPGLNPVSDDQTIVNDNTVTRTGGSSARFVQSTGALSVLDAPDGVGRYDQASTVNVATDDLLPDLAAWAVHLGTVDEPRYPAIPVNLARNYELAAAAGALTMGDRIVVTNTPAQLPPGGIDVLLQGTTETIASDEWTMTFIGSPASPWNVAVSDDYELARADTDGSVLAEPASASDTALTVRTTAAALPWTTDMRDTPFNIRLGGEVARVDAVGRLLNGNPYFATDLSGWAPTNATLARSTSVLPPHPDAVASMQITPGGATESGDVAYSQSAVGSITPGVTYLVSGWFYTPTGWSDLRPSVYWYTNAGGYLDASGLTQPAVPAGTWTYLECPVTAPANAGRARMRARHGGTAPSSQVYYVWGLRLTATDRTVIDTFSRSVTGGWGTSDSGHAWTSSGGTLATDYDVNGSAGRQLHNTRDLFRICTLNAVQITDVEMLATVTVPVAPTGDGLWTYFLIRTNAAATSYYFARLYFGVVGQVELELRKRTPSEATLAAAASFLPHTAGQSYKVRVQAEGSQLSAKVWRAGEVEPGAWQVTATDTSLPGPGGIGVRSYVSPTNTNALPIAVSFDDIQVTNRQIFSVTRAVNGVVKAQATGADVRLATPSITAL